MVFSVHIRIALLVMCAIGSAIILISTKVDYTQTHWKNYTNPWRNRAFLYTANRRGYLSTNYGYAMVSGLGNQLFELLAVIGIADKLNRIPYIKVDKESVLRKVGASIREFFPLVQRQLNIVYWNVTEKVVPFNQFGCCIYDDVELLKIETDEYLLLEGVYFQSYKYFDHLRSDIRSWLLPNKTVQNYARQKLPNNLKNHFLICVHIRRGDFVSIGWKGPSEANFSVTALQYLMRKYSRKNKLVGAVVLGNEYEWEKQTFQDISRVHVIENSTPIEDFAFSQLYCDVVLITAPSSTFGFFLGYLSKRFDVYYRDITSTKDDTQKEMKQTDFFPPTWTKIVEKEGRIKEIFNAL